MIQTIIDMIKSTKNVINKDCTKHPNKSPLHEITDHAHNIQSKTITIKK